MNKFASKYAQSLFWLLTIENFYHLDCLPRYMCVCDIEQLASLNLNLFFRMPTFFNTAHSWTKPKPCLSRKMSKVSRNYQTQRFVRLVLIFYFVLHKLNILSPHLLLKSSLFIRLRNIWPSGIITRLSGMIMKRDFCNRWTCGSWAGMDV